MFCPQCGTTQSEELKFCKSCGANLHAVRQAVTTREIEGKFDWNKTWVAEMLMSSEEHEKRKRDRQTPLAAEENRYKEIKAGVITTSVGVALMIFLSIFMQGVIGSGVGDKAAEILSRLWIAGIIPFFVGIGLMFNGYVVSKKLVDLYQRELQSKDTARALAAGTAGEQAALPTGELFEVGSTQPSVTEHTTRGLKESRYGVDHISKSNSV